jgi:ubiquinone/menaquinone biosynthesis C-methylase UbiE
MRSIILRLVSKKFLAAQLCRPFGLFGKFVMADFLNKHNEKMNHFAVERLDIQPTDKVLDIGFGGGITIEEMLQTINTGKIYGVEFSQIMVEQAKQKFKPEIYSNKVSIEFGDVKQLSFIENTFDKVCTVNTIYFWNEPLASLQEIKRVLKSNGKLVVGIRSADKMKELPVTQYNFRLYDPEAVRDLLVEAGFINILIDHRDRDLRLDCVMITAHA